MPRANVITTVDELDQWRDEWDRLAIENGRPYCAPAWMLAWWRHARPKRASLHTVVVHEGSRLVGIAPLFAERLRTGIIRLAMLGSGTSAGREPLADEGRTRDVAEALAGSIPTVKPRPHAILFEWIESTSPWPSLLKQVWPGEVWLDLERTASAPFLSLEDRTFDEWFQTKSGKQRREIGRVRRQLAEHRPTFGLARMPDELKTGLDAFARLHYGRWGETASAALNQRIEAMLHDVALELGPEERFRLWSLEIEGRLISVELFMAAGGHVSSWQGGYDSSWARYQPSLQTILTAVEHCWHAGDRKVDFGRGSQPFKYRFADKEVALCSWLLVLPGSRHGAVRAAVTLGHAARRVYEALPPSTRQYLKSKLQDH